MKRFVFAALAAAALACALPVVDLGVAHAQSGIRRVDDVQQVRPDGMRQKDLVALLKALRDRAFDKPGLTFGSVSANLVRITNATGYSINGVLYSKAATDNIAGSISGTALTATQTCYFRVEIDSAGTVTSVQGPIVTTASEEAPMPPKSANKVTLGYIRVSNYAGGFTPGTTSLNNAAVTFTDGDPDLADLLVK